MTKALWPEIDSLAALETGRYWTPAARPSEPKYRPAINNGYWAEDILTNGLVLYAPLWLYSGGKFPSVDVYMHTCVVSGPTWGLQGRTFDTVPDDYITCGANPVLNLRTKATWEYWINHSYASGGYVCLSSKGNWTFIAEKSNGTILFYLDGVNNWVASGPVLQDAWHHLVCTYDKDAGANNQRIYIDGGDSLQTTATGTAVDAEAEALHIGVRTDNNLITTPASLYYQGVMGEVREYNRALSLAEVQHNYNATRWRYR